MQIGCASSSSNRRSDRTTWRAIFALAFGVAQFLWPPSSATAQTAGSGGIAIELRECDDLAAKELERILRLELETAGARVESAAPPQVVVTCGPRRIRLTVEDAASDKRLEREIPAPSPAHPGRERIVALAASQLVMALDWLPEPEPKPELMAEPARRERPVTPPQPPIDTTSALRRRTVLRADAGVRVRQLETRLVMARFDASAGFGMSERWLAIVAAGYERGRADRAAGTVDATMLSFGAGLGVAAFETRRLRLSARGVAYAAYAELDGVPASPSTSGESVSGLAAELALSFGPTLKLSPIELGFDVSAGGTVPSVAGFVDGEEEVRLGGPWLGAALHVGVSLP